MLDQGVLAHPHIGLAQVDAVLAGQPDQHLAGPIQKLGIGGEHRVLGLHRRVDDDPRQLGWLDRVGSGGNRQALLDQRGKLFLAHALAPARQRRTVEHQPVLEELLAAEELVIGVLHPALTQHFVGQIVRVLQDRQPRHQPCRQRRLAGLVAVDRPKPFFQEAPVDRPRQLHQRMVHVDDLIQPRAQQILLAALRKHSVRTAGSGGQAASFAEIGFQFQGSSSSSLGWMIGDAASTSASHACGSTSFIFAVTIRVYMAAARSSATIGAGEEP